MMMIFNRYENFRTGIFMNSSEQKKEYSFDNLKSEDFDGHTEFHRLTPEQKLEALSQMILFAHQVRHENPSSQQLSRQQDDQK